MEQKMEANIEAVKREQADLWKEISALKQHAGSVGSSDASTTALGGNGRSGSLQARSEWKQSRIEMKSFTRTGNIWRQKFLRSMKPGMGAKSH